MKDFICIVGIVVCILFVGYIEDPCAAEGLMKGCMDKWFGSVGTSLSHHQKATESLSHDSQ